MILSKKYEVHIITLISNIGPYQFNQTSTASINEVDTGNIKQCDSSSITIIDRLH